MSSSGGESVGTERQTAQQNDLDVSNDGQDRYINSNEDDYSSTDEHGQRPGRFYGPDSSWRFYTQDERGLAASLDQAVNNDLSVQLYNVHALKARLRNASDTLGTKPWQSKQRWIVSGENEQRKPVQPRPKFSAWPLKPSSVPRSSEIWGAVPAGDDHDDGAVVNKNAEPWKPSLHLQEELKAVFLRQAKEQFFAVEGRSGSKRNGLKASRSSTVVPEAMPISDETGFSQADSEDSDSPSEPDEVDSPQSNAENIPELMADDEAAGAILQPTVRHMITKQDELLKALHLSRRGQRHDPSAPWRSQRSSRNSSPSGTLSQVSGRLPTKRKRGLSDVKTHDRKSSELGQAPTQRPRRKRKRALGQRDWSEVLGMAAMMGWDQSAIDRAARRCAAIFNEGMSMRFMAGDLSGPVRNEVVDYVFDMVPAIDATAESDQDAKAEPSVFYCPYASCERHDQPYSMRWRLREHLRRKHNDTQKDIDRREAEASTQGQRSVVEVSSASSSSSEDDDLEAVKGAARSADGGEKTASRVLRRRANANCA